MGGGSRNLLNDYSGLPRFIAALRGRGFGDADIARLAGGNYVRVFDRSTGRNT